MGKVVKGLLGTFGLGGSADAPGLSGKKETADIEKDKTALRSARSSLFSTRGGAVGEELQPGQIQRRDSLFGN